MSSNPPQLLLLADHINLSLAERQRAISLNLVPNSQEAQISRSLETLREGVESLENQQSPPPEAKKLRSQYDDLYNKFHSTPSPATAATPSSDTTSQSNEPTLNDTFSKASQRLPPSKSVRFTDNPALADEGDRSALFPYRDDPDSGEPPDQSDLTNRQIHEQHGRVLREQDEQLDTLGRSVGRQRELSMQIGDELDGHNAMLDELDVHVTRHHSQIDRARDRIGKIARKAKDNMQVTIIIILVIILVLLIIILK